MGIYAVGASLIEDVLSDGNTGFGIFARSGSTVRHCVVAHTSVSSDGNAEGISIDDHGLALENNVHDNANNGILARGGEARIEGNVTMGNGGYGVQSLFGDTVVVKNSARGNTLGAYSIGGPANVAPIDTTGTSTNPWVNFSY